ncbi:MAG: hypothetical protein GEU82_01690 [Luteitalea sp.]|nr:hypothetical protein [Luteitalea sp.]
MNIMKQTALFAVSFALLASALHAAEPAIKTVGYDNVHIRVSDPEKAAEWYVKTLGATPSPPPAPGTGQVLFGNVVVTIVRTPQVQPSAGSVIDHIGLSYPDIEAKIKDFEANGAKVLSPPRDSPGIFKYAYIEDPWGVKIEIVDDSERRGFHHVHLRVRDPQATLAWYEENFGGERAKLRDRVDGLRYSGVWLLAASSGADTPAPSSDRAIQNIALRVDDVDAAMSALKARGVKSVVEPRSLGTLRYGFVEDPNGVRVELISRAPN